MAEEEMRGIKFSIEDAKIIPDAAHRGGGQIIPTARRVFYAAELVSSPRFQEPIFLCEIQTPDDAMGGIY